MDPSSPPSSKLQTTPSKPGGDRYIPHRNASQMEVASFLLSKENQPDNSETPTIVISTVQGWRQWLREPRKLGKVTVSSEDVRLGLQTHRLCIPASALFSNPVLPGLGTRLHT